LLLAREAPAGIDPAGYLVSEKCDGVRAVWDGRVLRFRSGMPIATPEAFTASLPPVPLDGELWLCRGRFETVAGMVRRQRPDAQAWQQLRCMIFELPEGGGDFASRAARIADLVRRSGLEQLQGVEQVRLASTQSLHCRLDDIVAAVGERLMLHRADAPYETGRSDALLELKPLQDGKARVTGHVAGRGRHEGRLGTLRVRNGQGVDFVLGTGFSDAQRNAPPAVGTLVTCTHRGVTPAGVPRFASFLRVRSEHF
jgi:DNA ligase-1